MENVLELYLMLYRIEQKIRKEVVSIIKSSHFDLTFDQWLILRIIVEQKNGILPSNLATFTSKDKGAIHRICKKLKLNNFIETKKSNDNLLHVLYVPTKMGKECVQSLSSSIESYNSDFNKEYFDREYNALINLIERILPK